MANRIYRDHYPREVNYRVACTQRIVAGVRGESLQLKLLEALPDHVTHDEYTGVAAIVDGVRGERNLLKMIKTIFRK